MKKTKLAAAILLVLGVLVILTPTTLFPACHGLIERADGGAGMPMRCHWTGLAEIGVGILIACAGLLNLLKKTGGPGVFAMGAACGVVGFLLPTKLIGICMMPTMACRSGMAPALYVLMALVLLVSLAGAWFSARERGEDVSHGR